MKGTNNNQFNSKAFIYVMTSMLLLCALVVGFVVEFIIAGVNIVEWSFAARGAWLLVWTSIAFLVLCVLNRDLYGFKSNKHSKEE
jgi:hypothetical protein